MPNWREIIEELNPDALFIGDSDDTSFDEAIVGIGSRCGQPNLIVYDYEKVVQVFIKKGLNEEEAREFVEFNVAGAWVGEHTPILMDSYSYYAEEEELPAQSQAPNSIGPVTSTGAV